MSLLAIVEAANSLATLLESAAPRGLKRKRHAQHVGPGRAKIKVVIAHYFRRQERAVMAAVRPHIARQLMLHPVPVREAWGDAWESLRESSSPQGRTFAHALLPHTLAPLSFSPTAGETADYNEAITAMIDGAAETLARELGATLAENFSPAGRYLRDNSLSKLTGELNETSVERLQDALAAAWDRGGMYSDMVAAVQDTFADFSTARAELVAQTEGNNAYNQGRDETARELGMDEKSSETESGNPCPECVANEEQGWIGIDEDFVNGGQGPTFHPGCMCTANYRGLTLNESLRESWEDAWEHEPRNEKGEWTSGGDGMSPEEAGKARVERAKASAVRTGQHEQAIADRSEAVLSQALGVPRTPDNQAFDLENDDVGIEVKTLVNGKNEKITMSKTALGRKLAAIEDRQGYTVVVDRRSGGLTGQATYYYRKGFGSFRLGSMTKTTLSELRAIMRA